MGVPGRVGAVGRGGVEEREGAEGRVGGAYKDLGVQDEWRMHVRGPVLEMIRIIELHHTLYLRTR